MHGNTRKLIARKNFKCKSCQEDVQKSPEKTVNLDGDTLEFVEKICYLGNVLSTNERVHDSVVFKIKAEWNKFRELFGILCGRRLSQRTKAIVYKIWVKSAMCYGAKSWAIRVEDIHRLETTEMRMLRMWKNSKG